MYGLTLRHGELLYGEGELGGDGGQPLKGCLLGCMSHGVCMVSHSLPGLEECALRLSGRGLGRRCNGGQKSRDRDTFIA